MFLNIIKKFFGSVNERIIKSILVDVQKINDLEPYVASLSDDQLKDKTKEFKQRIANNESLDSLLHEAFAVVREASKRVLNMRHFDVQLIGGIALHSGKIAEMKTGEGKTLVSTLPCYLNALTGKNVQVVTPNDYLAKRDATLMGKVHEFLGLSVGCIVNESSDEERKLAYNCDITYATNNELGFDYLRDNMKYSVDEMVQRDRFFAIVDEVDSILIDEARTPLIISGPTNDNSKLYSDINSIIPMLSGSSYQIEEKERAVFLTDSGVEEIENILKKKNIIKENSSIYDIDHVVMVHHINQALKAHKVFKAEVDYIIKDGSIVIVDEFTGRMQEGRRFSDGLHQALEAKEGLRIRNENQTLASITFQNYFRLYEKLAGMTGTASTEATEFEEIYGLKVIEIPTNRPITRIDEDDEIYKTENAKNNAIVKSIKEAHAKHQPVLVGTTSIEKSEVLSKLLKQNKLAHNVLNAKYHEQEAEIIAQAGRPDAITIATNMAGRGTDIVLGGNKNSAKENEIDNLEDSKKIVIEAGGLYVLGSERHESRRIDNQLRGRSGRQGDPGKSKFFLSLEDDLMRIFGSEKLQSMLSTFGLKDDEAIFHPWITRTLAKAQYKVENRNYEIRKNLLKFDDIINDQRKNIFTLRPEILNSQNISERIKKMWKEINEDIVAQAIPKNSYPEEWNIFHIEAELKRIYGISLDIKSEAQKENVTEIEIVDFIDLKVEEIFLAKKSLYGEEVFHQIEKQIFLVTLDSEWKDHLLSLDKLRHGINLRAYAQKDPLIEYKREAFGLFEDMMLRMEEQIITRLAHVQLKIEHESLAPEINIAKFAPKQKMFATRIDPSSALDEFGEKNIIANKQQPKLNGKNMGRNEICHCKSGKKYKHCHGRN